MPTANDFRVRYDERGRPYYEVPGQPGRKSYVSPAALGTGTKPTGKGSLFRSDSQWNANKGDWERPINWGNMASLGVGAGLGVGALSAAGAFGGGAAASGTGAGAGAGTGGGVGVGAGAAALGGRNWITDVLFAGLPKVADLFGAKVASDASERAARIQADSYAKGLQQLREMYDQDRADFAPYRDAGSLALTRMGDLTAQPAPAMPASVQSRLTGPGDTYTPVPIGPGLDPRTMQPRPPMYGTAGSMADLSRSTVLNGRQPGLGPQAMPGMNVPLGESSGLPPGVPPGSVPINGGINPDAWAYQTPDGRIIRGSRRSGFDQLNQSSSQTTGSGPQTPPVSTTMPVSGGGVSLVTMQTPGGQTFQVSEDEAPRWEARGARRG